MINIFIGVFIVLTGLFISFFGVFAASMASRKTSIGETAKPLLIGIVLIYVGYKLIC